MFLKQQQKNVLVHFLHVAFLLNVQLKNSVVPILCNIKIFMKLGFFELLYENELWRFKITISLQNVNTNY